MRISSFHTTVKRLWNVPCTEVSTLFFWSNRQKWFSLCWAVFLPLLIHYVCCVPQGPLSLPKRCRSSVVRRLGFCRSDGSRRLWRLQGPPMGPVWLAMPFAQRDKRYQKCQNKSFSMSLATLVFFYKKYCLTHLQLWLLCAVLYCHLLEKWYNVDIQPPGTRNKLPYSFKRLRCVTSPHPITTQSCYVSYKLIFSSIL